MKMGNGEDMQALRPDRTEVVNTPPLMQTQTSEFIRWQLENDELIKRFQMRLLGLGKNPKTKEIEPVCRAIMNKAGVYNLITFLQPHTDKLVQLSNYGQDYIDERIEQFEHDLVDYLFAHAPEFGLDIKADLRMVHTAAVSLVQASMQRGLNAGTYKGMSMGFQHTEVSNANGLPRRSFWSSILPGV